MFSFGAISQWLGESSRRVISFITAGKCCQFSRKLCSYFVSGHLKYKQRSTWANVALMRQSFAIHLTLGCNISCNISLHTQQRMRKRASWRLGALTKSCNCNQKLCSLSSYPGLLSFIGSPIFILVYFFVFVYQMRFLCLVFIARRHSGRAAAASVGKRSATHAGKK